MTVASTQGTAMTHLKPRCGVGLSTLFPADGTALEIVMTDPEEDERHGEACNASRLEQELVIVRSRPTRLPAASRNWKR
jgi:hypothetical protein